MRRKSDCGLSDGRANYCAKRRKMKGRGGNLSDAMFLAVAERDRQKTKLRLFPILASRKLNRASGKSWPRFPKRNSRRESNLQRLAWRAAQNRSALRALTGQAKKAAMSEAAIPVPQSEDTGKPLTPYKQRRAAGEVELTPRDRLLVEYLTVGTAHPRARRLGFKLNEPLSLEQAAAVLDMRRRNCRQVFRLPAFQALLASAIADLRTGAKARAVKTQIEILEDRGENTAADRSVRLKAAGAILDDGEGKGGPSVNVQVNNVAFKAGWIIRLPAEQRVEPATIDAKPLPSIPAPPSWGGDALPPPEPERRLPEKSGEPVFSYRNPWD